MLVCHCRSVSDTQVRSAIRGSDDQPIVFDVDDVTLVCGAGSDCGGCHPVIESLIEDSRVTVSLQPVG